MQRWQFSTSVVLGALCVVLALATIFSARANQRLQAGLQAQQAEINKGALSQQIGTNLIRDIAVASSDNEKLKGLLARHGFTVTVNPEASPAPTATTP